MCVNVYEAKTNFSQLLGSIINGKETSILIAKNGKPVARMIPYIEENCRNRIGIAKGKLPELDIDAFNQLDSEVENSFFGELSL